MQLEQLSHTAILIPSLEPDDRLIAYGRELKEAGFATRIIVDDGILGLHSGGASDLSLVVSYGLRMLLVVVLGGICGMLSGVFSSSFLMTLPSSTRSSRICPSPIIPRTWSSSVTSTYSATVNTTWH